MSCDKFFEVGAEYFSLFFHFVIVDICSAHLRGLSFFGKGCVKGKYNGIWMNMYTPCYRYHGSYQGFNSLKITSEIVILY